MIVLLLFAMWPLAEANVCLPGVPTYASSKPNFFYNCTEGRDTADLTQCPSGEIYDRGLEGCSSTGQGGKGTRASGDSGSHINILEEPVVGQPVFLGDLYDARQDLVLNGFSFWNEETLEKGKRVQKKTYSNTEFHAQQDDIDEFSRFDGSASLKLSLAGGLISIEGSAKYLLDRKDTQKSVSFNLEYEATTRVESLPNSLRFKKDYSKVCLRATEGAAKNNGPTHVISSILYGMRAIMVFKKSYTNTESKQEVGGSLKVAVQAIPVSGEVSILVSNEDKEFRAGIGVKMYGDIILEKNPANYEEAIKTFAKLPSTMGDKESGFSESSPVKMQLTPISEFCDETDSLLSGISVGLMNQAFKVLVDLEKIGHMTRTLLDTFIGTNFIGMRLTLNFYYNNLEVYILETKKKLGEIIPKVRGGGGEEDLVNMIQEYIKSAFEYNTASTFLHEREKEINTISHLLDLVDQTQVKLSDAGEANVAKALLKKNVVFLYKFNVFSSPEVSKAFVEKNEIQLQTWFNDYKQIGEAGDLWRKFSSFVGYQEDTNNAYFVVASPTSSTLAGIEAYINGRQFTTDFLVPGVPPLPTVTSKTATEISLSLDTTQDANNTFITHIRVTTSTLGGQDDIPTKDVEFGTQSITISRLSPLYSYQFEVRYVTRVGLGPASQPSPVVRTYPSEAARNIVPTSTDENTLMIKWEGPASKANGLEFRGYDVEHAEVKWTGDDQNTPEDSADLKDMENYHLMRVQTKEAVLLNLAAAKHYTVRITPVFGDPVAVAVGRRSVEEEVPVMGPMAKPIPEFVKESSTSSVGGSGTDSLNETETSRQRVVREAEPLRQNESGSSRKVSREATSSGPDIPGMSATIRPITLPARPEMAGLKSVSNSDMTLLLAELEPQQLAKLANFINYIISYYKVDGTAEKVVGSEKTLVSQSREVPISGLAHGTSYHVHYQVRTSLGSSLRSPPLTVKTTEDQTELEKFRDSLGLDDINKSIKSNTDQITDAKTSIKSNTDQIEENSFAISLQGAKLHSDANFDYFKIPVEVGVTMVEGATVTACRNSGLQAVCNGRSGCQYTDESMCTVSPLETSCGNAFTGLYKAVCNGETDPSKCAKLEGMFGYMKGYSGGEYGRVGGNVVPGRGHTSGTNGKTLYAYCLKAK